MKKKIVTTLLALIAAIACLVGLVACGGGNEDTATKVAGKTYVFKDLEYKYGNLVGGDDQAQIDAMIAQLKTMYKGATLAFDNNGGFTETVLGTTATTGTYTQNKAKVVMNGNDSIVRDATVSGNELSYDYLSTYTFYYELKEGNGGENDYDDDGNLDVQGKIFIFDSATGANAAELEKTFANSRLDFCGIGAFNWSVSGEEYAWGSREQDGAQVTCYHAYGDVYKITVTSSRTLSVALDNGTLNYVRY